MFLGGFALLGGAAGVQLKPTDHQATPQPPFRNRKQARDDQIILAFSSNHLTNEVNFIILNTQCEGETVHARC